jgi:hypothetical protein
MGGGGGGSKYKKYIHNFFAIIRRLAFFLLFAPSPGTSGGVSGWSRTLDHGIKRLVFYHCAAPNSYQRRLIREASEPLLKGKAQNS